VRYGAGIAQRVDTIKYLGLYQDTKLGFSVIIYGTFRKNYSDYVCAEKIASFNYV
jgi:hypothetical protein